MAMDVFIFYSSGDGAALEDVLVRGQCERLAPREARAAHVADDQNGDPRRLDRLQAIRVPDTTRTLVLADLEQMATRYGAGRFIYVVLPYRT
jgi:hypothetical protein